MYRLLVLLCIFILPSLAETQVIQQATYILEKVSKFYKNNPKIEGNFELVVNGKKQNGFFYYLSNQDRQSVKLVFGSEENTSDVESKNSFWVVDKKKLWIYLNDSKVIVEQEIPEYFNTIGILGAGLSHYFSGYKDFVLEEIEKKGKDGKVELISRLNFSNPIKNKVAFQTVSVDIRDDGLQISTRATAVTGEGKNKKTNHFLFSISSINLDTNFNENRIFRVSPNGDVQILRNVLIN